jgi:hypothetical protein
MARVSLYTDDLVLFVVLGVRDLEMIRGSFLMRT